MLEKSTDQPPGELTLMLPIESKQVDIPGQYMNALRQTWLAGDTLGLPSRLLTLVGWKVGGATGPPVGDDVGDTMGLPLGDGDGGAIGLPVGDGVGGAFGLPVGDGVGGAMGLATGE